MYATFGVHFAYLVAAVTVVVGAVLLAPIPYHVFQAPRAASQRRAIARSARAALPPPFGRRR
jgi:hypothetical protein